MTVINTELIANTYAHIHRHPDKWDQSTFRKCFAQKVCARANLRPLEARHIRCAYEATPDDPPEVIRVAAELPDGYVWCKDRARLLMRVSVEEAERLFYGTPNDVEVLHQTLVRLFEDNGVRPNDPGWVNLMAFAP